jgi:hypothetical protein
MSPNYGGLHRTARKRWKRQVEQGLVACSRCGQPISPTEHWDLDHADNGAGYLGPSHRRCNRAAGAAKTNRERAAALRASRGLSAREPAWDTNKTWTWSRCWCGDPDQCSDVSHCPEHANAFAPSVGERALGSRANAKAQRA